MRTEILLLISQLITTSAFLLTFASKFVSIEKVVRVLFVEFLKIRKGVSRNEEKFI